MPHISLKAEEIFNIYGFSVTNAYLTGLIVIIIFFFIAWYFQKQMQLQVKERSTFFFLIHFINNSLYNFFTSILGNRIEIGYPIVASFFFYILLSNWFGLLPGIGSLLIKVKEAGEMRMIPLFRGSTADLNSTVSLGLLSVIITQYYGIKILGIKEYIKKFYNIRNPISLFTGTLEIISEFSKVFSFGFRLFGNIFAGEVLMMIIAFLIPFFAPFPFLLLELFVGFMQAVVFATLTAVFMNIAMSKVH